MTDIYIITSGTHSDYSIVSVWSSKEVAEENCKLLNAGRGFRDEFRVEDYPVDEPHDAGEFGMIRGVKTFYDFSKHGVRVDTANVVFEDALYYRSQNARATVASKYVYVLAESKEKGLRILFDAMAEYRANEEGIVP